MKTNIIFTFILCFVVGCGPNIAYGDYVNSKGMSRKQIEAIKNHPRVQVGIASYYGKKFHKKLTAKWRNFSICIKVSAAHKTYAIRHKSQGNQSRKWKVDNSSLLMIAVLLRKVVFSTCLTKQLEKLRLCKSRDN